MVGGVCPVLQPASSSHEQLQGPGYQIPSYELEQDGVMDGSKEPEDVVQQHGPLCDHHGDDFYLYLAAAAWTA